MVSGGRILALKEKGQLVGGELRARVELDVKMLGNDSEHTTEVQAGRDFLLAPKLREVERRLALYRKSLKNVLQVMERIQKSAKNGTASARARDLRRGAGQRREGEAGGSAAHRSSAGAHS
jgi:uncharacterized protein (DUF342 family)